jgi:hypothetical protein
MEYIYGALLLVTLIIHFYRKNIYDQIIVSKKGKNFFWIDPIIPGKININHNNIDSNKREKIRTFNILGIIENILFLTAIIFFIIVVIIPDILDS